MQTFLLFYLRDVIHVPSHSVRSQTAGLCLIAQISASIVSLPMGWASDHYGRKRFIYFSCVLMASVYIGYVFARTYFVVSVFAFIYGIGNGTYISVDYALASQTLPSSAYIARDLGLWGIAGTEGLGFRV